MSEEPPTDPKGEAESPEEGEFRENGGAPESTGEGQADGEGLQQDAADGGVEQDSTDAGLLNEDEINELFSRPDIDEALDDKEMDSPILPEGELSIDQDDIEALLNAGGLDEEGETDWLAAQESQQGDGETSPAGEGGVLQDGAQSEGAEEAIDQAAIEALLAGAQPDETEDMVNQSELDALLAQGQAEETGDAVDQSEIDALTAGAQPEDAGDAVDQSEIEALLAGAQPEDAGDAVDQSEIDALLAGAQPEEAQGAAEPIASEGTAPKDEAAPAEEEDEAKGKPVHPAQAVLDALVAAGLEGDEPSSDELEEVPTPPEGETSDEEEVLEPVPDAGVPDLVSSENVAASVPAEEIETELVSQELVDSIAEEAAAEEVAVPSMEELAEELGEEPPSIPEGDITELAPQETPKKRPARGPLVPPELVEALWRNLPRLMTSAAAGLVFAGVTYLFLQSHREQTPPRARGGQAISAHEIQQETAAARALVLDGRYGEGLNRLDRLLAEAPAGVDTTDAEFLRIESAYRLLPVEADLFETEPIHFAIDRFADKAPDYPRLAEALLWKANLYKRGEMLYEARRVYDRLLTSFGSVNNLDEILFAAAKLNLSLKRYSEAADQLRRLLNEFPGSPLAGEGRLLLADTYVARGDREAGREVFEEIAATQPGTRLGAQAYTRLGEMALEEGRYEEGIRLLEARLETATTVEGNEQVYLTLARAYRDVGRPEEAEQLLRELLDFFPESEVTPQALIELSNLIAAHGKRRDALQIAMQAAQRYPDNMAVTRNYAELLMAEGQHAAAARTLLATYAAGEADPDVLLTAGRLLRESYEPEEAKQVLERVVFEFPSSPQAFEAKLELAQTYRNDDDIRKALSILEGLLQGTEDQVQRLPVLTAMGEMYRELGIEQRTAQLYTEIARSTNEPPLLNTAALALFEADAWEQGLAVATRLNPAELPSAEAYAFLNKHGEALLRVDATRALEKMEQAYESYPAERTGEGDFELLKAYLTVGRFARARAMVSDIEAYARAHPVDAYRLQQAAIAWGDDLYERGDYRTAAEAYEKALGAMTGAEDDAHWARLQQANALFKLSDFEASVLLYDEVALSTSPWAEQAGVNAEETRLEQRIRGLPVTPQQTQG